MKQASVKKFSPWRIYAGGAVVCAALSAVAYGVGVRPATRRHAEQVASQNELHNARQKANNLSGQLNTARAELAWREAAHVQDAHQTPLDDHRHSHQGRDTLLEHERVGHGLV